MKMHDLVGFKTVLGVAPATPPNKYFVYTRNHSSCGFLVLIMDGLARHNSNVIVVLLLTIIT